MNTETFEIGDRVKIKQDQERIGGPLFPNRYGTIIRKNCCGVGYFYVTLDATKRGKERTELFNTDDMIKLT